MSMEMSFIKRVWSNNASRAGLIIIAIILLFAIAAPIISPHNPNLQDYDKILKPPSFSNLLGTDQYGRDVLSRIIYGTKVSLGVGIFAAFIALVLGTMVGSIAGLLGGWADRLLMRLVDILLGFPKLFVLLLAVGIGSPSILLTVLVLGFLSWMEIARIVRGEVIVVKEQMYVKSAAALGLGKVRIIFKYIVPNIAGQIVVSLTLLVSTMILVEASLSFLGLGVQPPTASWGTLLNQGRIDPLGAWWISMFTGVFIVVTVVGFNLFGDGLRNVLNPRSGRRLQNK